MEKASAAPILNTSSDTNMKLSNMLYKRRPPTPTRFNKRFELGELDSDGNAKSSKLNPDVEREEMALKDELLRIFHREKDSMEQHYLNKIQELLRSFKGKKAEWEEMVKAEREDLESQFEQERCEMHKNFTKEISALTIAFQQEKIDMERNFDDKLRNRDLDFDREKRDLQESWKNQLDNVKRQCQAEHEAMMTVELKNENEKNKHECELLEKKYNNIKYDVEKKFERDLADVEAKRQKICFDMEKKFDEEKSKLEREWQRKLELVEDNIRKEANKREEVERIAANDKANLQAVNGMLKEEIGRLKEEIDRLRKLPPPPPEVKIIEKTISVEPPVVHYATRADLPSSLRDDFDRILKEYKDNLKDKFQQDKTNMEEKLEGEKEKLRERIVKEKEELDKRLTEEKFRMERDMDRSRDDIEKEIERRLRTKQLSESLATQQIRFEEVTRRLEDEEKNRRDKMQENDNRKYENVIHELSRENEGLKVKVQVLQDNNKVLKSLKEEGQLEVDRLRNAVEELKIIVEAKRESDRTRAQTPAEFTPFLMSMMQQQDKDRDRDPPSQKSNLDDLSSERKKLEELKNDLQRQEKETRDRRTMEDAAKMVADKSQEKYDNLLFEKRKLEDALKALESRVVNMQDEFVRMRYASPQPPQQPPTQQVITQPQPIIVQPSYPPPTTIERHPDINITNEAPQATSQPYAQPQQHPLSYHHPHPHPHSHPQHPPPPPPHLSTPQYSYFPYPSFPHAMYSPSSPDKSNKIQKLKDTKDRLTKQLDEVQAELREANLENNMLQKQCHEFERDLEKLSEALERERMTSTDLKEMLSEVETKSSKLNEELEAKSRKLREELEKEYEKTDRIKSESEETKTKLQKEIQELQAKLHHAGQTLAAVRQQASNDITASVSTNYPLPPADATVGMVTLPHMPPMTPLFQANAERRRRVGKYLNTSRDSISGLDRTFDRPKQYDKQEMMRQHFLAEERMKAERREVEMKQELSRVRSLEEEKMRLQTQLDDAKGALDTYSGKLDSQLNQLQSKVHESTTRAKELSEENTSLNKAVHVLGMEQTNQARQNYHLRQQKMQLQKLIERLTAMNPQQQPPY